MLLHMFNITFGFLTEFLTKSLRQTSDSVALHSMQLQHDRYNREAQILDRKAMQQHIRSHGTCQEDSEDSGPRSFPEILYAINSLEQNDTLLAFLARNHLQESDSDLQNGEPESKNKSQEEIIRSAIKTPKDDKMVIEELKTNNEALKKFIDELGRQLEKSEQVKLHLRMQLDDVESSNRTLSLMVKEMGAHIKRLEKAPAKSLTNSDGGSASSGDVLKTNAEATEASNSLVVDGDLPQLAPLEMPQFDFNILSNQN